MNNKEIFLNIKDLKSLKMDNKINLPYFNNINLKIKTGNVVAFFDERDFSNYDIFSDILSGKKDKSIYSLFINDMLMNKKNLQKKYQLFLNSNITVFQKNNLQKIKENFFENESTNFFSIFKKNLENNENIKNIVNILQNSLFKFHKFFNIDIVQNLVETKYEYFKEVFNNLENFVNKQKKEILSIVKTNINDIINYENFYKNYHEILEDYLYMKFNLLKKINYFKNKIFNFMYSKIINFNKNKNIFFKEKIDMEKQLEKAKKLFKESKEAYLLKDNIKNISENIKQAKNKQKKYNNNIFNVLKSFKNNYYKNYDLYKKVSLKNSNTSIKFYYKKLSILNYLTYHNFKNHLNKNNFNWLNINDVNSLINDLNYYNELFLEQNINIFSKNWFWKKLKKQMNYEYNFDFRIYDVLANSRKKSFKKEIADLNNKLEIEINKIKIKRNSLPEYNENDLYEATKTYESFIVDEKWNKENQEKNYINNIKKKNESIKKYSLGVLEFNQEIISLFRQLNIFHTEFLKKIPFSLRNKIQEKFDRIENLISDVNNSFNSSEKDFNEVYDVFISKDITFKKNTLYNVVVKKFISDALHEIKLPYFYIYFKNFSYWRNKKFSYINIIIAFLICGKANFLYINESLFYDELIKKDNFVKSFLEIIKIKKIGLLFYTNNLSHLDKFASWIYISYYGKILENGLSSNILKKPIHPYTKEIVKNSLEIVNNKINLDYILDLKLKDELKYYKVKEDHFIFSTISQYRRWLKRFPESISPTISFSKKSEIDKEDLSRYMYSLDIQEKKIIDITYLKQIQKFLKINNNLFLEKTINFNIKDNFDFLTKTIDLKTLEGLTNE